MTVHASHVALLDLLQYRDPNSSARKPANIANLVSRHAMVELEHDDVRLAAVDAGVRKEIAVELPLVLLTASSDLRNGASDVVRLVRQIMRSTERRVTHAAMTLQQAAFHIPEGEGLGRLRRPACPAPPELRPWLQVTHAPRAGRDTSRTVSRSSADGSCRIGFRICRSRSAGVCVRPNAVAVRQPHV